jgi:hypothetical protein
MTELTVGKRLHSTACRTEIIVIRAPHPQIELSCAGAPMAAVDAARSATNSGSAEDGDGVVLGKRYLDEQTGLEVLCTKAGTGPLAADGRPLVVKAAKALPASD